MIANCCDQVLRATCAELAYDSGFATRPALVIPKTNFKFLAKLPKTKTRSRMREKDAAELQQDLDRHLKQQSVAISRRRQRSLTSTSCVACEATYLMTETKRRDKRLQPRTSCLASVSFVLVPSKFCMGDARYLEHRPFIEKSPIWLQMRMRITDTKFEGHRLHRF